MGAAAGASGAGGGGGSGAGAGAGAASGTVAGCVGRDARRVVSGTAYWLCHAAKPTDTATIVATTPTEIFIHWRLRAVSRA